MIAETLSARAGAAAMRFELLCYSWQSLFSSALSSEQFGYADHPTRVGRDAFALAEQFMREEHEMIARIITELAESAHQTTLRELALDDSVKLSNAALEHTSASAEYLANAIIALAQTGVQQLRQSVQRAQLEVHMLARAGKQSERHALIQFRLANQDSLHFISFDRAARRWSSPVLVRTLWRQALLNLYNDIVLLTLVENGFERAGVYRPEDGRWAQYGVVSPSGSEGTISYEQARAEIFHPNSTSYLAAEATDHV